MNTLAYQFGGSRDNGRVPRATYRVQLRPGFGFAAAAAVLDYLAELGVSHLYTSPYLQAAPGSQHGYDVVDYTRVNSELGGEAAHHLLCEKLRELGMGQVVDMVPNHMSVATRNNRWWWDLLENGPASRYSNTFDVEWEPPDPRLRHKLLLPILGDHYGRVLKAGHVKLHREGGDFLVTVYDEHILPASPDSLAWPLRGVAERTQSDEVAFIADVLEMLPPTDEADPERIERRHRDKALLGRMLRELCETRPELAAAIDGVVAEISADEAALDAFLNRQNYRLAYWRTARHELDYRRFFDINHLAALRMDNPGVFADSHALILSLAEAGEIHGIRVDHPDGLRDPEEYFARLREAVPQAWIVAEKILEPHEELADWPIDGTTGYDFLLRANNLFVEPLNERALTRAYEAFTGEALPPFRELVREMKALVIDQLLAADLTRLVTLLREVCEHHLDYRDYANEELSRAMRAIVIGMPVYRTYVRPGEGVRPADIEALGEAVGFARTYEAEADPQLFEFLHHLLVGRIPGALERQFVARFQQLTGPAMAKGMEDTAMFRHHRLISLNEVGSDPDLFGLEPEAFHAYNARMQNEWPRTMLATSTHDTKRAEDTRLRINLLSEIPEAWHSAVHAWREHNTRHRKNESWPDAPTEYHLYQALVGTWPISSERLQQYMEKATREAKLHTAWTRMDEEYESALRHFVDAVVADEAFLARLESFLAPLMRHAAVHAAAQVLLKLTSPGVPDVYQGQELARFCLTDPDNRRDVDFEVRRRMLQEVRERAAPQWLGEPSSTDALNLEGYSRLKLGVTHTALHVRKTRPSCYNDTATYTPLVASGPEARRVVAFLRKAPATPTPQAVATAVPRLTLSLGETGYAGTHLTLEPGTWRDAFTGTHYELSETRPSLDLVELWSRFPLALLIREA